MLVGEGGLPCRESKVDNGHSQVWGLRGDQRVTVARTYQALAEELGINWRKFTVEANGTPTTKLIGTARAAKLSGYSTTAINLAVRSGDLKNRGAGKAYRLDRVEVEAWAAKKKALGGNHGPRVRRKPHVNGKPVRNEDARVLSQTLLNAGRNGSGQSHRLNEYLRKTRGTMFEMSKEEFVERAVRMALDQLKA